MVFPVLGLAADVQVQVLPIAEIHVQTHAYLTALVHVINLARVHVIKRAQEDVHIHALHEMEEPVDAMMRVVVGALQYAQKVVHHHVYPTVSKCVLIAAVVVVKIHPLLL